MADTVIRVENLGKKYVIGHQRQERYTALRDVLAEKTRSLGQIFSRNGHREDPTHEEFWALKDVSFEIKQGDRVGIIGRNGAGKSTLLKILSRITEPTEGRISIKGRVASLLEVGTGFHPELTGRENIYLNGAILGMSKREIRRKFDEIVDFSEVEKFLDTPVKRYSSGMYVRLAFAVAAHLEPEILIVDEVLAVGDAQFQKKCLGKMEDVTDREGRTVLFVSHNIGAIHSLCNVGIYLEEGKVKKIGDITKTISSYYESKDLCPSCHYKNLDALESLIPKILEIKFDNVVGNAHFKSSASIRIVVDCISANISHLVVGLHIYNSQDVEVIHTSSEFSCLEIPQDLSSKTVNIQIPKNSLNLGEYRCKFLLAKRGVAIYDCIENISFKIIEPDFSVALTNPESWKGVLSPRLVQWS
jgi:lipopolysaccharide transport system ATP-binding protein